MGPKRTESLKPVCASVYVAKPSSSAIAAASEAGMAHVAGRFFMAARPSAPLLACSAAGEDGRSPSRPASPQTYPDLASVPARPTGLEGLKQRQALQGDLTAAREAANRRAAQLAYEVGRAAEPPPPPPPPAAVPAAAVPRPQTGGDGALARAYLATSASDIRDRGKLRQFMTRLGREAPDPFGPRTLAEALGLAGQTQAPGPAQPQPEPVGRPRADPLERFGDFSNDELDPFR